MPNKTLKTILLNQRGNALIIGSVAFVILTITLVMMMSGYRSTLAYKNYVQLKSSFTSVEDAIMYAFSDRNLYLDPAVLESRLTARITIPQVGVITTYSADRATPLSRDSSASDSLTACSKPMVKPVIDATTGTTNDPAEFIFCFSTDPSDTTVNANARQTFFGAKYAFGLVKVSLKARGASQRNFIVTTPKWTDFTADPSSFVAQISYNIFWGGDPSTGETETVFKKSGYVVRELFLPPS